VLNKREPESIVAVSFGENIAISPSKPAIAFGYQKTRITSASVSYFVLKHAEI
jgi:hypothetical protein